MLRKKEFAFTANSFFICTGGVPVFCPAFSKAGEMPRSGLCDTAIAVSCFEVYKTSKLHSTRSVLPRQGACFPCNGKFPKGNDFILFACTKRTKSTPEVCGPLDSGDGSKLYGKIFFVAFPAFVPKPVYGTTRFFGCFEPLRKGYCSTDARLMFFENGMPHCKLAEANVSEKGSCSLSLLGANSKLLCVV